MPRARCWRCCAKADHPIGRALAVNVDRDKAAMLLHGGVELPEDAVGVQAAIRDPFILEFLYLKEWLE